MGFSYNKLWKLLIDKNMKKTDLQCAIATTPKTIAKMGRDENVSLETLEKICEYFQCDVEVFDNFPKTSHAEALALLVRE